MVTLFSSGFLEKSMQNYEIVDWEKKKAIVKDWRESIIEYDKEKETAIKSAFFRTVFDKLLGYKLFGSEGREYHFKEEENVKNVGRADFVLGEIHNKQIEVMGELKSLYDDLDKPQLSRKDHRSPVQQGLEYLSNMPDVAKFLIVSNQNEIRIYKRGIHNKYNSFFFVLPESAKDSGMKDLTDDVELKKFIYLLSRENLLRCGDEKSITEKLLETQIEDERHLEKKFYAEYKQLREHIFFSLLEKNPEYQTNKAELLSLTQKFLDRIIFCWFCEDSREQLLPPDVLGRLIDKELKDDFYDKNGTSIYSKVKGLFNAINVGNPVFKIDKGYNGGLFETDAKLDKLKITNDMFETIGELSRYDFGNDEILNVNVLGHIFEQSISDLEELKSEFEGEEYDKKKSKRKKEGVYYTPEYITKYIVENTIGKWLNERFDEFQEKHKRKRKNKELFIYRDYQHSLQEIKVLDPACGSGAFLVEAFDYLLNENRRIVDVINQLTEDGNQFEFFDNYKYVNSILQNNLYGVDLNSESVEITKLSLWLKTAERNKKLTELDNNIKCGNSLIDDESIAGDKAFKWEKEFPHMFTKKQKDIFLITWVTHNSRISERMVEYKVKTGEPFLLNEKQRIHITNEIREIVKEDNIQILAYNLLVDHLHIVVVCDENELSNIVRKLKGRTSQKLKEKLKIDKNEKFHLWGQKFNYDKLQNEEQIKKAIRYVTSNREKHNANNDDKEIKERNKGLQPLVQSEIRNYIKDIVTPFTKLQDYKYTDGGFDCVIGNPPYVGQKNNKNLFSNIKKSKEWKNFYERKQDLYYYFIAKGIKLLKNKGYISYITPSYFMTADSSTTLRKTILENCNICSLTTLKEKVFVNVSINTLVFLLQKTKSNLSDKIFIKSYSNIQKDNYQYSSIFSTSDLNSSEWYIFKNDKDVNISKNINSILLGDIANISPGIQTGCDRVSKSHIIKYKLDVLENEGIFVITDKEKETLNLIDKELKYVKPFFKNSDLSKWYYNKNNYLWAIITNHIKDINKYPNIKAHLTRYKSILDGRYRNFALRKADKEGKWWFLYGYRPNTNFEGSKIICPYSST